MEWFISQLQKFELYFNKVSFYLCMADFIDAFVMLNLSSSVIVTSCVLLNMEFYPTNSW
jgi:hypothetical protein